MLDDGTYGDTPACKALAKILNEIGTPRDVARVGAIISSCDEFLAGIADVRDTYNRNKLLMFVRESFLAKYDKNTLLGPKIKSYLRNILCYKFSNVLKTETSHHRRQRHKYPLDKPERYV